MVPSIDVKDTQQLIKNLRVTMESVRQETIGWSFMVPNSDRQGEAMAVRQLAVRSAQQSRQWMGRMLKELDESGKSYPYPNSSDATTQTIDKTAVPATGGLEVGEDWTTVQRIKNARGVLHGVTGEFEKLLAQCIPGSFFNQCLFRAQEFAIQTGMWLGELLAEFVAIPQADPITSAELVANPQSYEALASGNDAAPTPSTDPSTTVTDSGLGAELSPVVSSPSTEAVPSAPQSSESTTPANSVTETLTNGSGPTGNSAEPALPGKPKKPVRRADTTASLDSASPSIPPSSDEPAATSGDQDVNK